jgi:hypothetical protein
VWKCRFAGLPVRICLANRKGMAESRPPVWFWPRWLIWGGMVLRGFRMAPGDDKGRGRHGFDLAPAFAPGGRLNKTG